MASQLKQALNGKSLLVVGGVIGLAALSGYFIYQYTQSSKTPSKTTSVEMKEEVQESPEKALIRVINSIRRIVQPNIKNLTLQSSKAIYKSHFQLSQKQFIPLTKKYRQERRAVVEDIKQYYELYQAYEDSLTKLHDKHLNAILAHFKIDKEDWMKAVQQLANDQQFMLDMEEGQFDALRKKDMPKIKFSMLIQICRFKAKLLEEKGEIFKEIEEEIDMGDFINIIQRWIYDHIYQKYKIEIEDIIFTKSDLNSEQKQQFLNQEDNYRELLNSIIGGDQSQGQ